MKKRNLGAICDLLLSLLSLSFNHMFPAHNGCASWSQLEFILTLVPFRPLLLGPAQPSSPPGSLRGHPYVFHLFLHSAARMNLLKGSVTPRNSTGSPGVTYKELHDVSTYASSLSSKPSSVSLSWPLVVFIHSYSVNNKTHTIKWSSAHRLMYIKIKRSLFTYS